MRLCRVDTFVAGHVHDLPPDELAVEQPVPVAKRQPVAIAQRKPLRRREEEQRRIPIDVEARGHLSATISLAS